MNWQCYSAHTQLHLMYMITYWLPLTWYLLVCSVSSHTVVIVTKLMSQHSFTLYIIAMQHSKRHNSKILRLHPGMGGRLGNRLVWIIPSWVALYFYAAYWSTVTFIRLFMYNFNCLSFIIWERLEKYVNITSKIFLFFIPYGYKYETLQYI